MKQAVAVLAALVGLVFCSACGTSHGESGSSVLRAPTAAPTALEGDVQVTLGAATAAAQANVDRFTAGDFAGVWEHMTADVRRQIGEADFVAFYRTCKKPGPAIDVTGVSLDSDTRATVSMQSHGVERFRFMEYQDGAWLMKPTDDFASHLGQPVAQIVAEERAAGLCDS
ncbi:hypothetical protein MMAD_46710 [Mycolicibacterium madagascariense]|uniref:Lipoprotein n=1 Tax=Mycolicibacterium madagascariense TaxID=212765 RepID=A0A7I7XME6_9MYCO|nr:hypothetical protein [Mycolicibacterium madagascariense]MCV7013069.1 hypothetical protein [Mycolicibacterium madagascariense]BBZ30376.1 hypothetical protein MMAD_46710 [Mycolicibacterium madagascariense]